jgi:hypothetical protein
MLDMSFEAFMAVMFHVKIFWVLTPGSVMVGYQCFRGPRCLHFQGEARYAYSSKWIRRKVSDMPADQGGLIEMC